jgi:dihydroorotate dehydrogenase electron transfer subunit
MLENAQVITHEYVGEPRYQIMGLVLKTDISLEANPGQFVHVQVSNGLDPLLRRPISIAKIDPQSKEITLLYRVRGKGTERLAQVKPGEALSVMGPLGRGFSLPEKGELILVAGGIGAFPLLALACQAKEQGLSVRLFWGGESQAFFESAGLSYWKAAGIPIEVSTLDGSLGEKGNVLDLIKKGSLSTLSSVAVCGPNPMMQALSEYFLELGYPVEVSLEERMGCAVGACLGCVCTLKDEVSGNIRRGKVCKDGPVFNAKEVLWNDTI